MLFSFISLSGFRVLSEAERTAALYSLLQHSTQVQIRFFITVLQQMARADPMTALLSPSAGGTSFVASCITRACSHVFRVGSMQSQMEAKLAQMSLKSPGIKSPVPASPSARTFNANRQSLAVESNSFLSPESAATSDAAATLVQQRNKLKANAAHRISAPPLASNAADSRNVWGGSQLSQVAERSSDSPVQELTVPAPPTAGSARPKSMDFSTLTNSLRSPRLTQDVEEAQLSPMVGGNWASMVNTPLVPMFDTSQGNNQNLDAAATKLANWQMGNSGGRFSLDDAKKFRRPAKVSTSTDVNNPNNNAVYDNDGNMISSGTPNNQQQTQQLQRSGLSGSGGRSNNTGSSIGNGGANGLGWSGTGAGGPFGAAGALRSPALSSVSSGRFTSEDALGGLNPGGFGVGMGMPSPGLAGMGMAGLAGMGQLNPLQMNMLNMANLSAMGLTPDHQLLAAQMAAAGGFIPPGLSPFGMAGIAGQPGVGVGVGMGGAGAGGGLRGNMNSRSGGGRTSGNKSNNGREGGQSSSGKDKDDDFDPAILNDVPAWLRSLRLHKYTPNFEGMTWKDMVVLDEAQLEVKGVAALGARRKMLKTFEVVRGKMGIDLPPGHSLLGAKQGEIPATGSSTPTAN